MQNTAGRILRQMRIEMHQSERRVTDQSARRTPSRAAVRKGRPSRGHNVKLQYLTWPFERFSAIVVRRHWSRNGSYEADTAVLS